MKHPFRKGFVALLLAVAMWAAVPCAAVGTVHNLGVSEGLSNGYVRSMCQDGQGYVWIATNDGLNRFDGNGFTTFSTINSGLTGNELNCVARTDLDPHRMYIATQRRGLCVYDSRTGQITKAAEVPVRSDAITCMSTANDGGLWLSHYHFGVQYYNPQTGQSEVYDFESIKDRPRQTWTVTQGPDGMVYAGHIDYGLTVLDPVTKRVSNYRAGSGPNSLPGQSVLSICVDRAGGVWVGTERGAALFNRESGTFTPLVHREDDASSIAPGRVWNIRQLDNDQIWFATSQGGISILDPKMLLYSDLSKAKFTTLQSDGSEGATSSPYVYTLFQDSFGNVWAGHFRAGLDVFDHLAPLFDRAPYFTSGPRVTRHRPVWSCTSDQSGNVLWLGGENELVKIQNGELTKVPLPGSRLQSPTSINAVAVDPSGRVWAGTSDRGALIYNPATQSFTTVEGIGSEVKAFCSKADGTMFIGTLEGIYASKDGAVKRLDMINQQLKDRFITAVTLDRHGRMWVGTYGRGVAVFGLDGKLLADYEMANGFISNAVNDIHCDSQGAVWVATRQGVAVFAPGRGKPSGFDRITELDDAEVTHVMGVIEGPMGNIWLSTNKGVARIERKTRHVTIFADKTNQVPLNSFFEGGAATDSEGRVYFASNNGLVSVNTPVLSAQSEVPPVRLTSFNVLTEGTEQIETDMPLHVDDGKIRLSHTRNTFVIGYNILDRAVAERCDFAFNMQGLNDIWTESSPEKTAVFRNLPPGTYKFRVKVRQKGEAWQEPVTLVTVVISPPWYLSWWSKMLYILLAIGAFVALGMYYKRRVDLKQCLAAKEAEADSRQLLNEERLRFYTNITHELRTPLTLILGPLEDMVSDPAMPRQYAYKLQMMRDSSNSLLTLINSILEFRKTETQYRRLMVKRGKLSALVREISLRFKELNRNADVEIVIDVENEDPELYFDQEIMTIILNNLLGNAVKYTPRGLITVSYHTEQQPDGTRCSVLKVSDTGYGIPKDRLSLIFDRYYQVGGKHQASGTGLGLALVKSLADLHRATVVVESEEGRGSVFTVSLPTDCTYDNEQHAPDDSLPGRSAQNPDSDATNDAKLRLLVVEDNDDIREYIAQTLAGEFEVLTARNGLEGLHKVQNCHPDMIISDIMMPEMDGVQMCRLIKDDILTSHIPVILLTAKDSVPDKEEGYNAGADSYLTKPFSAKLLLGRIHNLLRSRRRLAAMLMSQTGAPVAKPDDADSNTAAVAETVAEADAEQPMQMELNKLDRRFMDKILEIVHENIAREDLGVAFIADRMCMSSSTLYRKIMAIMGMSTNEYIRRIRMARAAELLTESDMTVTDIAFHTGFGSHSSFAKVFKKEYGMTASEYQTRYRKKE